DGAFAARVHAILAVECMNAGDMDAARAHATEAVHGLPPEPQGRAAALVLQLFAEARQRAIGKALREKQPWPPQLLSDVDAAYGVLAKHPFGTDDQVVARYDLLRWLGATRVAN